MQQCKAFITTSTKYFGIPATWRKLKKIGRINFDVFDPIRQTFANQISSTSKIHCSWLFQNHRRAKFQKLSGLYYKFSPVLVKHIPRETVEAWISCERYLNPKKLIPALIQCNQTGGRNQATPEEQVHTLCSPQMIISMFFVALECCRHHVSAVLCQ